MTLNILLTYPVNKITGTYLLSTTTRIVPDHNFLYSDPGLSTCFLLNRGGFVLRGDRPLCVLPVVLLMKSGNFPQLQRSS